MPEDAPRNDVGTKKGLSDFDSEVLNSALDKTGSHVAFNRNEPDTALEGTKPVVTFDRQPDSALGRKDPEILFNRQERDITSGAVKPDIQPDEDVLSVLAPSVQPFEWHPQVPVVHRSARRNIGIPLLVLWSIGVVAWSGRLLMGTPRDPDTSGARIQDPSEPTPAVRPAAPTNAVPPAPDPQPSATDVPAKTATPFEPATAIATPSEAPGANAPDAPGAEQPARQAERPPVKIDPGAPGGLFAITRPLGAQVFLDNKLIGTTPLFMSQVSSGSHEVRLELPGFNTYSSSIQVEPNGRFRLAVQLEGPP